MHVKDLGLKILLPRVENILLELEIYQLWSF